jgi:hypothetical protein
MNQSMGDIFFRRGLPSELANMPYTHIEYWAKWCRLMTKEEIKARNSGGY